MKDNPTLSQPEGRVWWHYRIMWLVVGAPLVVVAASLTTGYIAIRGADPVVGGVPTSAQAAKTSLAERALVPAQLARNHAATPTVPTAESMRTPVESAAAGVKP